MGCGEERNSPLCACLSAQLLRRVTQGHRLSQECESSLDNIAAHLNNDKALHRKTAQIVAVIVLGAETKD